MLLKIVYQTTDRKWHKRTIKDVEALDQVVLINEETLEMLKNRGR